MRYIELDKDRKFLDIEKASDCEIDFSCFPSVEELWISSKKRCQIPNSLTQLNCLKKLIIGKNCILPENINQIKSLKELWLNNSDIYNMPETITGADSITDLNISYYDKDIEPKAMPYWIFEMKGLEKINLNLCRFNEISPRINQLSNLTELNFGCSLSDINIFPDLSGLVKLNKLKVSAEAVQGQRLPSYSLFIQILDGIKNLHQLKQLDLSGWRPKRKAEWLVAENGKHSIPDLFHSYPNLTELSVAGMNLDFIPRSIFDLQKLTRLNVTDNKLTNEEVRKIINHLPNCSISSDIIEYKPRKKR